MNLARHTTQLFVEDRLQTVAPLAEREQRFAAHQAIGWQRGLTPRVSDHVPRQLLVGIDAAVGREEQQAFTGAALHTRHLRFVQRWGKHQR